MVEMNWNDKLLASVKARGRRRTKFGYGVRTADVYARTLAEAVGMDACYRYAATRQTSFDDLLKKAARTLVYSNPEMVIEQKDTDEVHRSLDGVELPKNTLMVFRHVLTTSVKDRDGDVLHSDGAEVDANMLLLWQHLHTMPIGKMLIVVDQNAKHLKLVSAIVDVNATAHDAAVMVDNGMGRFSHGFRALEFTEQKADDKPGEGEGGFDVRRFEIMEESLVSVPANVDAETEEVLLSMVEGGKLTSPLMKEYGKALRERRPVLVPGTSIQYREQTDAGIRELSCNSFEDLQAAANAGLLTKGGNDENKSGDGEGEGSAGASKEADDAVGGQSQAEKAGDAKVTYQCECVECGHKMEIEDHCRDVKCFECGGEMRRVERPGPGVKASNVKLNTVGSAQANKLITAGKVDRPDGWDAPSAAEQNAYIEANDVGMFGRWHLGKREGADAETKAAWAYPYTGDFRNVNRQGLIAIRTRAGQQKETEIFDEAGKMIDEIDEEEEEKGSKSFYGDLSGSWEWIEDRLRDKAKPFLLSNGIDVGEDHWVTVIATYPDRVVLSHERQRGDEVFYLAGWKMVAGEPEFDGEPKVVKVKVEVSKSAAKAGRVLSKANEGKIKDARDDVDEASKMEGVTRPCRALLRQAVGGLGDVLSSLGEAGEAAPATLEIKDIVTHVLTQAVRRDRDRIGEAVELTRNIEKQRARTNQYRALKGS